MTREEAINEIKSWDFLIGKEIEAVRTLIPELRESEDERIRKEIIDFIQWAEDRGMTRHDYHQEKRPAVWIAYLEKQKEQKPVDYDHEMWKNCEANFEGGKKEVIDHPEKYGLHKEQKPTISDEAIREGIVHFGITQYQIDNWLKKHINIVEQKEQKPADKEQDSIAFLEQHGYTIVPPHAPVSIVPSSKAIVTEWSEEEKQKLNRIYVILGQAADTHAFSTTCRLIGDKEAVELQDFIRSIAKPQTQEWSDEDERMVRFYEADYNNQIGDMSMKYVIDMRLQFKNWLVNRLKSLRPQPHWKPSEEQMRALIGIICFGKISHVGQEEELIALKNQLLKLM